MKVSKVRLFLTLAAAGITALVLIQPQQAIGQVSTGGFKDGGVLRLQLGATDRYRFQPVAGDTSDEETQAIAPGSGCGLTAASQTGALAKLTATGGSVGFVSDSLGVRGPGEGTGQPCGRIDGSSQTLSLELGSRFTSPSTGPKRVADFAEIDLEGKFNAAFQITGTFGSSTKTETYDTTGSDSGPDSGDGDNYRVRFPKTGKFLFTKLTFSVTSGGASLEGGADGTTAGSLGATILDGPGTPPTATTDSLFHLLQFDGTLNCGGSTTETGGGTSVLFRRLSTNIDGDSNCLPIPYSLDVLTGEINLLKDLLGEDAQFEVTITWAPKVESYPLGATTIDYDGPGGNAPVPLQWCLVDGPDTGTFPDLPTGHFYCIQEQHATSSSTTGLVTVIEKLYGQLDPNIRR